ncbi:hypothetical protein GCM10010515_40230 [Streptomyces fructofermentans]|uniref:Uncharacterized protein n=1 Tax=Streptomyces fructofermentans TaxID=152141 RepID=A0A918KPN3_9ACTN|nr:hypothetical protein GCM10010515_40230 [Streptomyces fructofermentans]
MAPPARAAPARLRGRAPVRVTVARVVPAAGAAVRAPDGPAAAGTAPVSAALRPGVRGGHRGLRLLDSPRRAGPSRRPCPARPAPGETGGGAAADALVSVHSE